MKPIEVGCLVLIVSGINAGITGTVTAGPDQAGGSRYWEVETKTAMAVVEIDMVTKRKERTYSTRAWCLQSVMIRIDDPDAVTDEETTEEVGA